MAKTNNALTSSARNLSLIQETTLNECIEAINKAAHEMWVQPKDAVVVALHRLPSVDTTGVGDVAQPLFNMAFYNAMKMVSEDTVIDFKEVIHRMSAEQSRFGKAAYNVRQPLCKDVLLAVANGFKELAVTKHGMSLAYKTAKAIQKEFLS